MSEIAREAKMKHEGIRHNIQYCLKELNDVCHRQKIVKTKTTDLYVNCETLIGELDEIQNRFKILQNCLPYFTDLENLAQQLGFVATVGENSIDIKKAALAVPYDSNSFNLALVRIDECIAYIVAHVRILFNLNEEFMVVA